jgi:hypothetical protein
MTEALRFLPETLDSLDALIEPPESLTVSPAAVPLLTGGRDGRAV